MKTAGECIWLAASASLLLGSNAVHAACSPPSEEDMRARYERALAMLPEKLIGVAPDAVLDADWSRRPGSVILTNAAGERRAVELATGASRGLAVEPAADAAMAAPRSTSPDRRHAIEADGFDLVLVDLLTGAKRRMTTDGTPDLAYAIAADTGTPWLARRLSGEREAPYGLWSADGRYFATLRVDQRGLRSWPILLAGPEENGHRLPQVQTSRIALPGDQKVPTGQIVILDIHNGTLIEPGIPPLLLSYQAAPIGGMRWSEDSRSLWAGRESRDYRRLDIWVYELGSRSARVVTTEVGETAALRPTGAPAVFEPIGSGDEFVLYSERDGRGHLYLHDGRTGHLKHRLTGGDWSVAPGGWGTLQIDSRGRTVYFTAVGRERGRDPYYHHLYSVRLDGGAIRLLTPENAHHHVEISLDGRVFLDRQSTPATGTVAVLRRLDGKLVAKIVQVDVAPLRALGWIPPERFQVLAADGKTPLWGTLVRPPGQNGARCQPIVDAIYAGPQTINAGIGFLDDGQLMNATAQLGFAVMQLDARGTPLRERSARDATWGPAFGSQVVADDHAAAIRQLAERFDTLDAGRAGIYGHSWGGY